ncbi:MAG: hypothetical protein IK065_06710 [Neisseriaceae bacterium]|nr:hypothetical protein [Neisseriaceae bacterium]
MKKISIALCVFLLGSANVFAEGDKPNQELLSAQIAYRQALQEYSNQQEKLLELESQAEQIRRRVQQAQAELQSIEQKINEAKSIQENANNTLQAAGERLDKIWSSSRAY